MGKKKPGIHPAPDHLTMRLYGAGMGLLHRAGLGGLACTLEALENCYRLGLIDVTQLPAPFDGETPPWEITDDTVTLRFGSPAEAGGFLKRLFAFAFQTQDGLIYLPGQYGGGSVPPRPALADLQAGLTLTFLQHGKTRRLAKTLAVETYDPESTGARGVTVEYRSCEWFKHQDLWKSLIDKGDALTDKPIGIEGPVSPGTVVRHVAFSSSTGGEEPVERALPLYFALIGCLALPINRGVGVLVVPEVNDLQDFAIDRPLATPRDAKNSVVASGADAAFRMQLASRRAPRRDNEVTREARNRFGACYAMTFTPTPWASQQKSRVATMHVDIDDSSLDRFEVAMATLPLKIVERKVVEKVGKGNAKRSVERTESFRSDSVVRPLIAVNLACGRKWYEGFDRLMTRVNPANDKPYRDRLPFERTGLHAMIQEERMWDTEGERAVVEAVHAALRTRYKQIADENEKNPTARQNRWAGEYDRWRLAFAGSKTADQFRESLCDMLSRGRTNTVLQDKWLTILPMLRDRNWRHARDLALLGLCSYRGKGAAEGADTTKNPEGAAE